MRFHRIRLERFRGIDAETIEFGDAITIIEGPNEVGKSTIAEAIGVLFDHLDSSRRQEVRAVHQIGADVGPYVELEFSVGEYDISYAKRFLRKPSTMLRISAPETEQLSGREAHDRMATILKETVDAELWAAMRVNQGQSLQQPDLADVGALRAALDDDARSGVRNDDDLMERVLAEYTRYFTPRTGQPTGDLSKAVDAYEQARARCESLATELAAVDEQVRRAATVESELAKLAEEEDQHTRHLEELQRAERTLDAVRREHTDAEAAVTAARTELEAARRAVRDRTELTAELSRRQTAADELATERDRLRTEAEAAGAAAEEAREHAASARELAQTRERAHRNASDVLQLVRMSSDATALEDRLARATAAREEILAADRTLAAIRVDDETLQRLVDLEANVRTARELRRVAASSIEIESLGDADVRVDGADADAGRQAILGVTTVEVPEVLRVTVRPGGAEDELATGLRAAQADFDSALDAAGVADLAAARAAAADRREAATARELAEGRLSDALGDIGDYDELATRVHGLRERCAALRERLEEPEALPDSVDAAERAADEARTAYDEASETATAREHDAQLRLDRATEIRETLVRTEQHVDGELAEAQRLRQRLDEQRGTESDEQLAEAERDARVRLDAAERARDQAAAKLADGSPDELATRLQTARTVGERIARSRRTLEDERQQLAGQLDGFAARGLHDQHAEAAAELERAEDAMNRVEARAEAARLLHDTLRRHRDTARQRYVAPFRDALEGLGRVVFGDQLSIEVGDDLTIASRTWRGDTVAFDSLSGGAREQLAVLGRLAAASLVDAADGAPLILDDAFGYADPQRLERLAAVLNRAGHSTQIVILTCHPERFRAVGDERTVLHRLSGATVEALR